MYHRNRAEYQTAHALGAQLLTLARHVPEAARLVAAHRAVGATSLWLGATAAAHAHFTQGMALYDPSQHRAAAFLYGDDAGVVCHSFAAWTLWLLGYPDQELTQCQAAVTLALQLAHPYNLSFACICAAMFHQFQREVRAVHERAAALISLATAQGLPYQMAIGSILRGWTLAHQGQAQEGIEQITQSMRGYRATGAELLQPYFLALLAEAQGTLGAPGAGLTLLTEALTLVDKTGERWDEPALYRLKGALLLHQSTDNHPEAERCFHHARAKPTVCPSLAPRCIT